MPKPADLAILGLRPHDYFTGTRSLSTLNARGCAKRSRWPSGRAPSRRLCRSSKESATTAGRSNLWRTVERFTLHARACITRAPLTSTPPRRLSTAGECSRIRCRTSFSVARRRCSGSRITIFSLTLAEATPPKSSRPNGLPRSGSNPHCYRAQTAHTTQQPTLPPTLPLAPRPFRLMEVVGRSETGQMRLGFGSGYSLLKPG
jgi:hypothetical protein